MSDSGEKSGATQPAETPDVLPRPDFHFPGQIGRTYLDSDPAQFPQPVSAPKGAPNVLLILIDDCGFGQYGARSAAASLRRPWTSWRRKGFGTIISIPPRFAAPPARR
jgi:hypothetical protein